MYANILIPVDGSEYSKSACRVAAELTQSIPGKETLHLLHCIVSAPGKNPDSIFAHFIQEQKENAERYFHDAKKILEETGNHILTHIRQGYAGSLITETAKELKCGMIIMGTRGRSDLAGALLGSVSHDVLQLATVPVLLVNKSTPT